jgi:hypothetical protein
MKKYFLLFFRVAFVRCDGRLGTGDRLWDHSGHRHFEQPETAILLPSSTRHRLLKPGASGYI